MLLADKQIEGGRVRLSRTTSIGPTLLLHIDLRNNPLGGEGIRQLAHAFQALSVRLEESHETSKLCADACSCSGTAAIDAARAWLALKIRPMTQTRAGVAGDEDERVPCLMAARASLLSRAVRTAAAHHPQWHLA